MRAGALGIAGRQPGHRQAVFGTLGFQPGAGQAPATAAERGGVQHQVALGFGSHRLVDQRRGGVVAGDGQRADGRVVGRQCRGVGGGGGFVQQRTRARAVVQRQQHAGARGDGDALAGVQRGAQVAAVASQCQRGAQHAQRPALRAGGVEAGAARQRRQVFQAVGPAAQVFAVDMAGQARQREHAVGVGHPVQRVGQAQRDAPGVVGVVGPGLVDEGLQVAHVGFRGWSMSGPR
jgi:hypothetical protein